MSLHRDKLDGKMQGEIIGLLSVAKIGLKKSGEGIGTRTRYLFKEFIILDDIYPHLICPFVVSFL